MSKQIYNKATEYIKRGWVVHKLYPPTKHIKNAGKRPTDTGWQNKESVSIEQLQKWFLNDKGYNIGVQCGKRSDIIIIDFDNFAFRDELFKDIDIHTLQSKRIDGRGHYFFKYSPKVKSKKYHKLGFEILSDGNQAVIPPSIHPDGQKYKWVNAGTPIQKFPLKLLKRMDELDDTMGSLVNTISKCRSYIDVIWREKLDIHNEDVMVAVTAELKKNGVTRKEHQMFCKILLGSKYDKKYVAYKYEYIKPTPWKIKTLLSKMPSHIKQHVKFESVKRESSGVQHNPQDIDYNIAGKAKYYKDHYYFTEKRTSDGFDIVVNAIQGHHQIMVMRYDKNEDKYYDDDYRKTGETHEISETNSAYFVAYVESLKDTGLPITDWVPSSETCSTRVYKRMVLNELSGGWATELFTVCRVLNDDNQWEICNEYVPNYSFMHSNIKKRKIRTLYKKGVPIDTLYVLFGYKSRRSVEKITQDLRQRKCKFSPPSQIQQFPKKKKEALN